MNDKKYYAQILIEVELNSEDKIAAESDTKLVADSIINVWFDGRAAKILETEVFSRPSDAEFLKKYGVV